MPANQLAQFNGFGGLHGGVLAAASLRRARNEVDSHLLPVELSTTFLKPVTSPPRFETDLPHRGRAVSFANVRATTDGDLVAMSQAIFASRSTNEYRRLDAPLPEALTPLASAERFIVPPEFVPVSAKMEIRPATVELPYAGGSKPELCAWIRLLDPVLDPAERLAVLADALAPSYAAILSDLALIPTVRMTVQFSSAAAQSSFDWVLVQSRTVNKGADAWLVEQTDIWTPDGRQLATATQLRRLR